MSAAAEGNKRGVIFLLGALTALAPFSTDMYLPGLPAVARSLSASPAAIQSTISIFFFGMALGQIFHGPLSDRFGRKPLLIAGLGAYGAASGLCALAGTVEALSSWRMVQAFGGCAGLVISRAVARDRFEQQELVKTMALLVVIMCVSPLIAPFAGAWVVEQLGWRAIFWLQAAAAMALLLAVVSGLSETRSPATLCLALRETPLRSYGGLLAERDVRCLLIAACAPGAAAFCWVAASAHILIETHGLVPHDLGYVFVANALGILAASQINIWLARRWPIRRILMLASYASVPVAGWLIISATTGAGGLMGILAPILLLVSNLAFTQNNAVTEALGLHPLRSGSLSALFGSGVYFAGFTASFAAAWVGGGSQQATAATILIVSLIGAANAMSLRLNSAPDRAQI